MALTYLKIFADMEETLSLYSDEERGRLLSAMMAYSFRGEEPEFTGAERFVWPMLRNHIDSCENRSEKMKANGKCCGRPESKPEANESKAKQTEANESKAKQTEANESKTEQTDSKTKPIQEQDHEQEHVHDQDHKSTREKRTRFVPPTPEEVQAYMLEQGGTHVQAVRFMAHYGSNGWKVGKNPMKNWKDAVRGWISRDKEGVFYAGNRASPPNQDKMMRYTPEERKKTYSAAVLDFDEEG